MLVPYTVSILGFKIWGNLAFSQFILQYFMVLVGYGFSWSAVHEISKNRENKIEIINILSSVLWAQLLLVGVGIVVLIIGTFFIPKLHEIRWLIFYGYIGVVGSVLFPGWFLRGLEDFKMLAVFQISGQIFGAILLLIFLKNESDVNFAALAQGITYLFSGCLSLYYIIIVKKIMIIKISIDKLLMTYKKSWVYFKSQVLITLYTNTLPVILGFVASSDSVAAYALADKVQKAVRFFLDPVTQALFPRISYVYQKSKERANFLLKKTLWMGCLFAFLSGGGIFMFSENLLQLIDKNANKEGVLILKIFSVMPLLVYFSNSIVLHAMIPRGMSSILNKVWSFTAVVALICSYPIAFKFGSVGIAVMAVVLEIFIVISFLNKLSLR